MIIDPALSAFSASGNDPVDVRSFLGAVEKELQSLRRCGCIIVHHSTKEDRRKSGFSQGTVAGSASWTDKARSAMLLERQPVLGEKNRITGWSDFFHLELIKSNYSPYWKLDLEGIFLEDRLCGFAVEGDFNFAGSASEADEDEDDSYLFEGA